MSCDSSSVRSQSSKEDLACGDAEKSASSQENMYPKITCRSVSEESKGEVFLRLLLSVSGTTPRDEDYGTLSAEDREDVDRRMAHVRKNIAMKALKVELKRLARRKLSRKHKSFPVGVADVDRDSTIHEDKESLIESRLPPNLPEAIAEGVEEVDGPGDTTSKPPQGWASGSQHSTGHCQVTEETHISSTARTPSTPGTTPPLQTSQPKQSVQRVDSTASSRSTDSGYTSDRGVYANGGRRGVLESLAEDEQNTPTPAPASNYTQVILKSEQFQGDPQTETDGSSATPKMVAKSEDVFSTSFKQAMTHQVRFEQHSSIEYDERGGVVGVSRERSIEETTVVVRCGGRGEESEWAVQLSEEELSMAGNEEEAQYLCQLKCRYQAEFSSVMEFQELMKRLDRPPTISDYLAFKLKSISDRYDSDYDAPISNAVSMIVSGSMDKGLLSDSFFSSAVEPLLRTARKAADLPFLMNLLGRRLVEVVPQIDEHFQHYSVRLVREMMADGVVDLVGRTMAHDIDEVLDTDDIIAVLTDNEADDDLHYNPQELSELIQRHFSSSDDLTKLPGVPGVNRTVKTTRKLHPSTSDEVDGPIGESPHDSDCDSGTDSPPGDPPLSDGPPPPPGITGILDELADSKTKSLGRSVMKTVPFVLMVALQNLT